MGLPLRLRAVYRSRAALVPHPGRDLRLLQSALSHLLRREWARAPAVPQPGRDRAHARRCRSERGPTRRGADLRRRADDAPGVLSRAGGREGTADSPPDGEHERREDCRERGVYRAARVVRAGPGDLPAVRFIRARSVGRAARCRPSRGADQSARAAQQPRHLDHARCHAEERTQRSRDRQDYRLRDRAALCAWRHVPTDPGRGENRQL